MMICSGPSWASAKICCADRQRRIGCAAPPSLRRPAKPDRLGAAIVGAPRRRPSMAAYRGLYPMMFAATLTLPFWHFQIPLEILVLGAIAGTTYALFAMGLTLVYQSSRVLNF